MLPRGRDHAFFEQPQFQGLLGHDLLQIACLSAQILDLARRRRTCRVARQALLPSLEELLGPAVIQALGNALTAAQLGNAVLALEAIQHDPDLLFGRILFAGRSTDVLDDLLAMALLGSGFLSHLMEWTPLAPKPIVFGIHDKQKEFIKCSCSDLSPKLPPPRGESLGLV